MLSFFPMEFLFFFTSSSTWAWRVFVPPNVLFCEKCELSELLIVSRFLLSEIVHQVNRIYHGAVVSVPPFAYRIERVPGIPGYPHTHRSHPDSVGCSFAFTKFFD